VWAILESSSEAGSPSPQFSLELTPVPKPAANAEGPLRLALCLGMLPTVWHLLLLACLAAAVHHQLHQMQQLMTILPLERGADGGEEFWISTASHTRMFNEYLSQRS